MRLLLAEDEKELAKALAVILRHNSYSVDVVHNGEDALCYLENAEYDGAILDIMMPKLDGLSVLKKIRDMGNGKFEIDVQFYADHYYLCPSHVVTYYATVTDDDVFKYCIEKAVITEEGNYEPF